MSLEGGCKTLQAHLGGKTVLHLPQAMLFDAPKLSCLTFGCLGSATLGQALCGLGRGV